MNKINKINVAAFGVMAVAFFFTACSPDSERSSEGEAMHNVLTAEETEAGWFLLFDGESTDGWRGYNRPDFPRGKWQVEDGTLFFNGSADGEGGDIIYDRKFKDFRMQLEWKVSEGGNSGIFYLGKEIEGSPIWISAPEMQILDNERHPDANQGVDGNRKAGSLYDLIPADPQNSKPAGEWNHVEIVVDQGTVTHYQNGETVLEYALDTPEWEELIGNSKFNEFPEFGRYEPGYIALQDHSDDVWFRNIKVMELE